MPRAAPRLALHPAAGTPPEFSGETHFALEWPGGNNKEMTS